ncbi:MAG TPA: DUF3017 domain-containing protein [Streptomyces sp.]|nr:DUF3017 domain-containing protein [Streptomyces sp.]
MSEREALPMGAGKGGDAGAGPETAAGSGADVSPEAGADATPGAVSDAGPAVGADADATPDAGLAGPDAAGSASDASGSSDTSGSTDSAVASGSSPDPVGEPASGDLPEDPPEFTELESKGVVSVPSPEGPVRSTRRFPLFTRDTARPEGGGRAAPGDAAAPVRQWPFLAVMGATALGLLVVAVDLFGIGFRLGTLLIGLSLIGGAVMRRLIPSVGMLAVRSRFTDMVTYGLLGFVISMLAMMAQPKPWLEIPFLEAVVRFTVR